MFIRDPGSWLLSIPDPGSGIPDFRTRNPDPTATTKEDGGKKNFPSFFCRHNNHKIKDYFYFLTGKKKIWANSLRVLVLFIQKIVTKLSKCWFAWDPGSEIWDPRSGIRNKTYSGSRIQGSTKHPNPDPGFGSATLILFKYWKGGSVLSSSLCVPITSISSGNQWVRGSFPLTTSSQRSVLRYTDKNETK